MSSKLPSKIPTTRKKIPADTLAMNDVKKQVYHEPMVAWIDSMDDAGRWLHNWGTYPMMEKVENLHVSAVREEKGREEKGIGGKTKWLIVYHDGTRQLAALPVDPSAPDPPASMQHPNWARHPEPFDAAKWGAVVPKA